MPNPPTHTLCWQPTWNDRHPCVGLEHVVVSAGRADSSLLAIDEDGAPFRLAYRLQWDAQGRLRQADLAVHNHAQARTLSLRVDEAGRWLDEAGAHLRHLDGCVDIDIWPTPLTNSFPIWRSRLQVGQRAEFRMAWVSAPALTVEARLQAYTRLQANAYLFESLDGSGFQATLPVDDEGFVIDYPGLFRRVALSPATQSRS